MTLSFFSAKKRRSKRARYHLKDKYEQYCHQLSNNVKHIVLFKGMAFTKEQLLKIEQLLNAYKEIMFLRR